MKKRLPDPPEIDRRLGIYMLQAFQYAGKGGILHTAKGLVPLVAETGDAVKAAGNRRHQINLGQMSEEMVKAKMVLPFVQPRLRSRFKHEALDHFSGQYQPLFRIDFRPD